MSRSGDLGIEERRWLRVLSTLNEAQARLYVADKAMDLGRGGISWMSELTGMSRTTITKVVGELVSEKELMAEQGRIRERGAGRRKEEEADRELMGELQRILEETTAGDPMSELRWTNKSAQAMGNGGDAAGTCGERQDCGAVCARDGVHDAVEPPNQRSHAEREAGCPVSVHQPASGSVQASVQSCAVGGHKEEGTGRTL
jgi:hypothetical protein